MGDSLRGSTRLWRRLQAEQRAKRLPCFLCGQPIDYSLQWPDPQSFSADHIRPWEHFPELRYDPGNVASSHLKCNQSKGDNNHYSAGLGLLSEEF